MAQQRLRQIDCVRMVLEEAQGPLTLYGIQRLIQQRWKRMYSDAAISARVRDIRKDLEQQGKTVAAQKIKGRQSFQYWITSMEGVA